MKIGKNSKSSKVKTKKKRNFIEDLPMDLHIDDSIDDGQLEVGEEQKEPEPLSQPVISNDKQVK